MTLELLVHQYVITLLGKVQRAVLMLGQDVTVCSAFYHQPHYIGIPSFTSLRSREKTEGGTMTKARLEQSTALQPAELQQLKSTAQKRSLGVCPANADTTEITFHKHLYPGNSAHLIPQKEHDSPLPSGLN